MSKQPTITRGDLVRVLTEASLFARQTPDIPVINAVRLEATGTHLIAAATDRFIMGASSAKYEGRPFAITLPMAEVKLVLSACKMMASRRRSKDVVDLRVTPKATLLHVTLDETAVTVPTLIRGGEYTVEYPDWRKLLGASTAEVGEVLATIGINPQYLAKFGKIGPRAKFYLHGPHKPVMVRIGENFVGLIMPIRLPDEELKQWALPDWLETPTAAVAKAAS